MSRLRLLSGYTIAVGLVGVVWADLPSVDELNRLPSSESLREVLRVLALPELPEDQRQPYLIAFSHHARVLSPHYGQNAIEIDVDHWIGLMQEGLQREPDNCVIALALTKWLIDQQRYAEALAAIERCHAKAPSHESRAWVAHARHCLKAKGRPEFDVPTVDVHFCVITKNRQARKKATLEQFHTSIEQLNRGFVTRSREKLVNFRFKSATFYREIARVDDAFRKLGDARKPYDTNEYAQRFNECTDPRIRDPHAINFYVFDGWAEGIGSADATCHGKRNSNRPYVLIDWARLDNTNQNPIPHEFGHAFGLGHVSVVDATRRMSTNIMGSTQWGFGSGGNRLIGFSEAQAATIRYHAQRTLDRLR